MMPSSRKPTGDRQDSRGVASTSRSLLVRIRDNDSDAWERLITLYTPLVYYWARKSGVPDQDMPDVVQEVFKSVATGIDRFRKDRPQHTFRGWLRTITRSKAMDHFRRQSKQPHAAGGSVAMRWMTEVPEDADDDDSEEEPVYHALFLRACDLIRADFHENTWKAFWRVVVDGLPPKEVAEELDMQPGTVRVAKSRVLQRLRQELGELLE